MLCRFMSSKKGFTMMEILIVVIVLGILTAVAVPTFSAGLKKQRVDDCRNQRLVIQSAVQQAMFGMIDNGKKQTMVVDGKEEARINFSMPAASSFKITIKDENDVEHNAFKLTGDTNCFTLGALRGGYRDITVYPEYRDGCDEGYYLKKQKLANTEFYRYLDNQEVPICPFEENNDSGTPYFYYILEDGSVHCTCPECE